MYFFDKVHEVSIDAESALTFEKHRLVTELKLKMSKSPQAPFLISTLPLEVSFKFQCTFCIYGLFVKKVHS